MILDYRLKTRHGFTGYVVYVNCFCFAVVQRWAVSPAPSPPQARRKRRKARGGVIAILKSDLGWKRGAYVNNTFFKVNKEYNNSSQLSNRL